MPSPDPKSPGDAEARMRETLKRLSGQSHGLDAPAEQVAADDQDVAYDDDDDDRDLYDEDGIPLKGTLEPIRNDAPKVGRNDPCPCGSGRKFKKCCGK